MSWTSEELQFDSLHGQEMSLFESVQICSEAPSASYLMDNWGIFLGVKQTGHEVDHSSTSSAKVK